VISEEKEMLEQSMRELSDRNHQLFEELVEKDETVVQYQLDFGKLRQQV
jgi:hypothetical protein